MIQGSKPFLAIGILTFLTMQACSTPDQSHLVYVGTYTGHGSEGIYAYRFDPEKGELKPIGLVAKTDNPSFLAVDQNGHFLYAVNEIDSFAHKASGAVSVFSIQAGSGKLDWLQQVASRGASPAHLSLDESGRYLMVANYFGGNAAVFSVGSDGKLGPHTAFIQDAGSGLDPDRQSGPHAHFIQTSPGNHFVLIADLGIDQILVHRFDQQTGSLSAPDSGVVKLPPGSGPRHLAFTASGNFCYVLNELTSTVTLFAFEPESGHMQLRETISSLPPDFTGTNTTAEIVIDSKDRYLYLSNRGANSIGVFGIHPVNGRLTPVQWISTDGDSPRHFEIDPTGKWLLAANQRSNNLVLFRIDPNNGQLVRTSEVIGIDSPVCVRFLYFR